MESVRTCVGCRHKHLKTQLLRFVTVGPRLVPDPLLCRGGRGVYLCPQSPCLEAASKRGGFARGMRRKISVDQARLRERCMQSIAELVAQEWTRMLSDGRLVGSETGALIWQGQRARVGSPTVRDEWERLVRWSTLFEAGLTCQ